MRRPCGFAIAALKRRAKVGDSIYYQRQQWTIVAEGDKLQLKRLESTLAKLIKSSEERWCKYKDNDRFAAWNYEYKLIKKTRQRDYRKYDWYQIIRRVTAKNAYAEDYAQKLAEARARHPR